MFIPKHPFYVGFTYDMYLFTKWNQLGERFDLSLLEGSGLIHRKDLSINWGVAALTTDTFERGKTYPFRMMVPS